MQHPVKPQSSEVGETLDTSPVGQPINATLECDVAVVLLSSTLTLARAVQSFLPYLKAHMGDSLVLRKCAREVEGATSTCEAVLNNYLGASQVSS